MPKNSKQKQSGMPILAARFLSTTVSTSVLNYLYLMNLKSLPSDIVPEQLGPLQEDGHYSLNIPDATSNVLVP
jgi:hypothetical protein